MAYCKDCLCFKECQRLGQTADFPVDDGVCCNFVQMTNADRIRAMTDEELVDLFRYRGCPPDRLTGKCVKVCVCEACWVDWLKQPYEGE